ncbi:MAG: enoyl-CoA hydratase/isomerase family protein, partial [Candidatus Rokuibacteriota bacterium]
MGDVADAPAATRAGRRVVPDAAARALLARLQDGAELSAQERRPGLRGPPRSRRPRLRQGHHRGPDRRGHDDRRRPARRPPRAVGPPLPVLPGAVLPHQLLAGRRDLGGRCRGERGPVRVVARPEPATSRIGPPTPLTAHAAPPPADLVVLTPIADGVLRLTLNRPQALNALNRELTWALESAVERVATMQDVRVLLVCGRGRAFCAGNDIKEMETVTGDEAQALATRHATLMDRFSRLPQVTLAVIDGHALGGGLMLAVAQDLRIASDRARLGLPEVTLGFNPGYGI